MAKQSNTADSKNNPKKKPSLTKTVETGAFIRTTIRVGKKRKTETVKFKKNQKKVILGRIGDLEVYVYPYDFPDTVFIGKFPISTQIDSSCVNQLISAYNKARWYLNEYPFSESKTTKGAKMRRHSILSAYNRGLEEIRGKK